MISEKDVLTGEQIYVKLTRPCFGLAGLDKKEFISLSLLLDLREQLKKELMKEMRPYHIPVLLKVIDKVLCVEGKSPAGVRDVMELRKKVRKLEGEK